MKKLKQLFPISSKDFITMTAILLCALAVCAVLIIIDNTATYASMVFLLAILLISRFTSGYLYGLLASVLAVFIINYCFTYPYFELNMTIEGYPITIVSMFIISCITSAMTTQIKEQEKIKAIAEKEKMRSGLLRAISHDLRTPLTSILGASSAMLENSFSDVQRRELLLEIKEDAQWLLRIVENLLSVTRLGNEGGRIHKTQEAAEEIAAEAVQKLKKRYPDAPVSVSVPDELLFIPMDPLLIEQVLINLLENSIKHGKTTTKIELSVTKEDKFVRFSVKDNGIGIASEEFEHLFTDYYKKSSHEHNDTSKNIGIGLSVCMSIIKAHNGEMQAENLNGKGAQVSFILPL